MHSINPDAARAGGTALTPLVPLVRAVVADQRHPRVAGGALECDRGPLVAAPLVGHHRADERDQRREGRAARSSGVGVDGVHDGADALEAAARLVLDNVQLLHGGGLEGERPPPCSSWTLSRTRRAA